MDQKKVGRNDPCPCGSGKKYKHCHMLKEQESKKTYTPSGKRKFTAKVIKLSDQNQALFERASASGMEGAVSSFEDMKFKMANHDFRVKSQDEKTSFFRSKESSDPTPKETATSIPTGEFQSTQEDFRVDSDQPPKKPKK